MTFTPPRDRDAWGTIRGFVYQVALTIERWLRLEDDQVLELERGEDIDLISGAFRDSVVEEQRVLEQIKRLEGTITLNSPEAREAVANFVEHRLYNPGTNLRFCFVTTASITRESKPRVRRNTKGIAEWESIAAGVFTRSNCLRPLAEIRHLLRHGTKPDKLPQNTWNSYQAYLKRSRTSDFYALIASFRWSTGQAEPEDVRIGIERSLQKTGIAQNEGQARGLYNALFVHVFHLLAKKGPKRLTTSELKSTLSCGGALNDSDRKLIAYFDARLAQIASRVDHVESKIEEMSAKIIDMQSALIETRSQWDNGNSQATSKSTITHDFKPYIDRILQEGVPSLLPTPIQTAFKSNLSFLSPETLHSFCLFKPPGHTALLQNGDAVSRPFKSHEHTATLQYSDVFDIQDSSPIVLIGESGIGKSFLLAHLRSRYAQAFTDGSNTLVPVLIKLGTCTRSHGIFNHIRHATADDEGSPTFDTVCGLLRQGRLLLLLDALDEVVDESYLDIEREIRMIITEYKATKIIITTRPQRVPSFPSVRHYAITDLLPERAERLLKRQLPKGYINFNNQIRARRLERLTSNTLLLTLLVLLFRKFEKIPTSRMLVLKEIVESVGDIEREKPRSSRDLDWDVKLRLLSTLAFQTVQEGDGYSLGDSSLKASLRAAINELEDSHDLQAGTSWRDVLAFLEVTGFVRREGTGVTFWHRAFLEYFAAIEMSRLLELDQLDLSELVRRTRYEAILPMALAMLPESRWAIIKIVGQLNCFVAAEALAEMGSRGSQLVEAIIPHLQRCLLSEFHSVRKSAMEAISRISSPLIDALILDLLRNGAPDIQIAALVEIARRRLPDARAIIDERLAWDIRDEFSLFDGQEATFHALGELGDRDAQRMLVDRWKAADVRWIGFQASLALRNIARRGELCPDIESELCEWFVGDNFEAKNQDVDDLKNVLIVTGSRSIAQETAKYVIRTTATRRSYGWPMVDVDILASFDDPVVVRLIADSACNLELPARTRQTFAHALAESIGEIPFDACVGLCSDADYFIRAEGLNALARFPFANIRTLVLSALRDVSLQNAGSSNHGHERLQSACIAVLTRHGQLRLLLQNEFAPSLLYLDPLRQLLSVMGTQRIAELVPFLRGFTTRDLNTRLLASAALAFGEVGELDLAQRIFEHILTVSDREFYTENELLKGAHRLPAEEAIRWIDRTWAMRAKDHRVSMDYMDALVKVGTVEARQRLVALLDANVNEEKHDTLWILKSLHEIATSDMEGWLIDLHKSNRFNARSERGWILSMLGKVGTERAESVLVQCLNAGDKWQRHMSFRALQELWRRCGYIWFNGEETSVVAQPQLSEEPRPAHFLPRVNHRNTTSGNDG